MKNIKIVIVEDEMIVSKDLENNLISAGYDVIKTFISGESLLVELDSLNPDIILMDIMLDGELTGIQTAEILNRATVYPIIFITAHAEREKVEAALKTGIYGYIVKPYNLNELENTIDITLTKHKMLKQLEENEKRFQAIVDNSQNGIVITTFSGDLIFMNLKAQNIFSDSNKQPLQLKNIQQIIGEDDWKKFFQPFINSNKEKLNTILTLKGSYGEDLKLDFFCNKIYFSGHENIVYHIYDITDQYNSIKTLRMLATAIRSIDECLYITDSENKLLYINQTFCDKFEYEFYDVLGEDIFRLIYRNQDLSKLYNIQTILEQNNWSGELELITKNGTIIPVFITISATRETDKFLVGVIRDMSNELSLKKQINQVQRLESIGILAGGIAHDFNNLLSIIGGYSDLMLSKLDRNDRFWDFLNEIHKAGERAANLTRQLLLFSKTNPGEIEVMNVNDSISHLFKMLNRIIGENIKLELHLEEEIHFIEADKGQIDQILMNLAVNARDAIHEKKELNNKITISTQNVLVDEIFASQNIGLVPGEFIRLSVKDTGNGIPSENIDKIFDPFFTTKGVEQGTGLGLSTVYGIVKKFNGAIFVKSERNIGTEFSIYFPKTQLPCDAECLTRNTIRAGSGTILIVEDSLQLLNLSEKMLDSIGYKIYTADNGDTALNLCNNHQKNIDLVFIDLIMPEYNGIDLYHLIQKIIPDVKVLYTSGYDDVFLKKHNMEIDPHCFIRKPFEISKLSEKISFLLKSKEICN